MLFRVVGAERCVCPIFAVCLPGRTHRFAPTIRCLYFKVSKVLNVFKDSNKSLNKCLMTYWLAFLSRPARYNLRLYYARLIAKKFTDGKKSLYKCFFAIYNINTSLGDLVHTTACEVEDYLSTSVLCLNLLDCCRTEAEAERCRV